MNDFTHILDNVEKITPINLIDYHKVGDYLVITTWPDKKEFITEVSKGAVTVKVQKYNTLSSAELGHTLWRIKCVGNPEALYDIDLDRDVTF